ncbi:hypothetical protein TNCV_750751 [Trichonephila clavipes]|nr:hypothetical protein TNCV_750751 [Trichonephila clavipes]
MASGSYITPIYSRSQSEVQGDLHKSFKTVGLCEASKETIFTQLLQLHVALSRRRSKDGIKMLRNLEKKVIRNIVFEEEDACMKT